MGQPLDPSDLPYSCTKPRCHWEKDWPTHTGEQTRIRRRSNQPMLAFAGCVLPAKSWASKGSPKPWSLMRPRNLVCGQRLTLPSIFTRMQSSCEVTVWLRRVLGTKTLVTTCPQCVWLTPSSSGGSCSWLFPSDPVPSRRGRSPVQTGRRRRGISVSVATNHLTLPGLIHFS